MKKLIFILSLSLSVSSLYAQTGQVKVNGITIAYESFGKTTDPVIILIGGTGAPMTDFPAELCQELANKGYRVIRFDNRDTGLSTKLDSLGQPDWAAISPFIGTCKQAPLPYTLLDMAKDVTGLMDALKIDRAHIAGTSMGGAIAQLTAIYFPERVLTLTCMAATDGNPGRPAGNEKTLQAMGTPPPTTNNPDSLVNYLISMYKTLGSTDDEMILKKRALEHINRSWYPEGTNRQAAAVLIGDYCDRRPELAKINIPVMVIQGDADPVVPPEASKELAASIPGAELCMIKGMGHDISMKFVTILADDIARNAGKVNE